jgi:hypothetical protein
MEDATSLYCFVRYSVFYLGEQGVPVLCENLSYSVFRSTDITFLSCSLYLSERCWHFLSAREIRIIVVRLA